MWEIFFGYCGEPSDISGYGGVSYLFDVFLEFKASRSLTTQHQFTVAVPFFIHDQSGFVRNVSIYMSESEDIRGL
jgi:hypothetical protein